MTMTIVVIAVRNCTNVFISVFSGSIYLKHPNISIDIPLTALFLFSMVLTRRICSTIRDFFKRGIKGVFVNGLYFFPVKREMAGFFLVHRDFIGSCEP